MERQWHIIRTGVGTERQIESALSGAGFEVYNPTRIMKVFNRKFRSWRKRHTPMFPGYMFVYIDHPRHIPQQYMMGARGFMRNGDRSYSTISLSELKAVRLLERFYKDPQKHSPDHPFALGDTVELSEGALKAFKGVVRRLKGKQIEIETEILGRYVSVTAPVEGIRAA